MICHSVIILTQNRAAKGKVVRHLGIESDMHRAGEDPQALYIRLQGDAWPDCPQGGFVPGIQTYYNPLYDEHLSGPTQSDRAHHQSSDENALMHTFKEVAAA